jgi:Glycosyl hydrolase family 79 C-terminal beta domain
VWHHRSVRRHGLRNCCLAGFTAALLTVTVAVLSDFDAVPPAGASPGDPGVSASVSADTYGGAMGTGFVGVSLEYSALHVYTGRDPRAVNPVLVSLLRGLAPGSQTPVLRIGGNSADATWWPVRGAIPPGGIRYALTPGWIRTTHALAQALKARLILGVNLAGGRPALSAAEARALLSGIGRKYVQALEIGNEPDVYNQFPWYRDNRGRWFFARSASWNLSRFIHQFSQWRTALPRYPLAGPAFAELTWLSGLPRFIKAEHTLGVLTVHRYPLRACVSDPNAPGYATTDSLLTDGSSAGLAQAVAPYVPAAHAAHIPFRLDEMNSASCAGKRGVSDTFASALWVLDTLFNLANVGVDGVNVHSLPGAAYELFTFSHAGGSWRAFVHPEYYGMMLFARAFPPGARLLQVNVDPSGPVKVWATRDSGFHTHVVLINKDPSTSYQVQLQVSGLSSRANLQWLTAPSADSTSGVTFGGQTFGDSTSTGVLSGPSHSQTVSPTLGTYTISMPPASAALLTQ